MTTHQTHTQHLTQPVDTHAAVSGHDSLNPASPAPTHLAAVSRRLLPRLCDLVRLVVVLGVLELLSANALAQGNFVYVNRNITPNSVAAFSVAANGALTNIGTFPTGGNGGSFFYAANRETICAVGSHLYVSNPGSNNVSVFDINPATGALTAVAGSPFATGGLAANSLSLACTPDGRFLIAVNDGSNNITVFSVGANGALTPIAGSPFANPSGTGMDGVKVTSDGKFLMVALALTDQVAVFSIAPNGALAPVAGSPFASPATGGATGVEINCASNLLFVGQASFSGTNVDVFNIGANGTLTPVPGSPFNFPSVGSNSNVVVLSPDNRFLFVSNQDSNTITVFNVATNGALTLVPGAPFANPGGSFPQQMATNQVGTLLYVNNGNGTVSVFSIAGNGALAPVAGSPFADGSGGRPGIAAFPPSSGCAPPTIAKSFNPTSTNTGGVSQLILSFSNLAGNPALTNLAVTDNFPAGLTVAATPGLFNNCGGTVMGATPGSSSISLSGGTLAAGASSCQVKVNVTSTTPGTASNTTGNVTATIGSIALTGNTANATLTVVAPPTIAKSFTPATIRLGEVNQLTLTFTSPAGNLALTNLAISDNFPAGLTVAPTPGLSNTCGGTVTGATAGSSSISLSGGALPAGASSCQVQVNVTSTTGGTFTNTTGNVTATSGSVSLTGNTASATLTVTGIISEPVVKLTDPFGCTGPGDVLTVTVTITNTAMFAQPVTFTAALPAGLVGLPGSSTSTVGAPPTVTATSANFATTLTPMQSATVTYKVQVGDASQDTTLCITTTSTFSGTPGPSVQACATVNCEAVGPGAIFPATAEVSDQKAGSVLVYNLYSSSSAAPNAQNTRISITNVASERAVAVHLFFVDGATCSISDSLVCLTPNQTATFLASDIDPGATGYIIAVASDPVKGCPINFNYLIGDEYVKLSSGHAANLAAEAFAALPGGLPACNSLTAVLNFDGVSYNRAPRVLAASNIPSRADGNDTLIVLNRLGGSLATGAATLSAIFGILYDDTENPLSFSFSPGTCQFRSSLSNNFPRTAPRFEQFIPAGRSGWAKFYSLADIGLLGAQLNFNPNAGTAAQAFNQGHNLHKLTLTSAAQLTIPIFPPNC